MQPILKLKAKMKKKKEPDIKTVFQKKKGSFKEWSQNLRGIKWLPTIPFSVARPCTQILTKYTPDLNQDQRAEQREK